MEQLDLLPYLLHHAENELVRHRQRQVVLSQLPSNHNARASAPAEARVVQHLVERDHAVAHFVAAPRDDLVGPRVPRGESLTRVLEEGVARPPLLRGRAEEDERVRREGLERVAVASGMKGVCIVLPTKKK